jgi:hypothetical protein
MYTVAALAAYRVLALFVNFGIIGSPEILNVLLLAGGIVAAVGRYHRLTHRMSSWTGMQVGMLTSLITMLGYAIFVFFLYTFVDPAYLRRTVHYPAADEPNGLEIAATALIEGIMYGVIVTLAAVEFYKVGRTDKRFEEAYE